MKRMNLLKKCLPLFMALTVLSATASAENYIDTDMTGSVTMTLTRDAKTVDVSDGVIDIYYVANIVTDEFEEYAYEYTEDFKSCTADLSDPSESSLPDMLIEYIDGYGIVPYAETNPVHGTASFNGLSTGLYLVREKEASEGYYAFLPFVVTIPVSENGTYIYDVDAAPKLETIIPETETETKKDETEEETEPATEQATEPETEKTAESETEQVAESETEQMTEVKIGEPVVSPPNDSSTETPEEEKGDGSTVQTGDYMTYGFMMILAAVTIALILAGMRLRKKDV